MLSLVVHGERLFSGCYDSTIKVWSTITWTHERTLEGHKYVVYSSVAHETCFSADPTMMIKVRNTDTWACDRDLEGYCSVQSQLVQGGELLSGSGDSSTIVRGRGDKRRCGGINGAAAAPCE